MITFGNVPAFSSSTSNRISLPFTENAKGCDDYFMLRCLQARDWITMPEYPVYTGISVKEK